MLNVYVKQRKTTVLCHLAYVIYDNDTTSHHWQESSEVNYKQASNAAKHRLDKQNQS